MRELELDPPRCRSPIGSFAEIPRSWLCSFEMRGTLSRRLKTRQEERLCAIAAESRRLPRELAALTDDIPTLTPFSIGIDDLLWPLPSDDTQKRLKEENSLLILRVADLKQLQPTTDDTVTPLTPCRCRRTRHSAGRIISAPKQIH